MRRSIITAVKRRYSIMWTTCTATLDDGTETVLYRVDATSVASKLLNRINFVDMELAFASCEVALRMPQKRALFHECDCL